jgi:hypothetical protein
VDYYRSYLGASGREPLGEGLQSVLAFLDLSFISSNMIYFGHNGELRAKLCLLRPRLLLWTMLRAAPRKSNTPASVIVGAPWPDIRIQQSAVDDVALGRSGGLIAGRCGSLRRPRKTDLLVLQRLRIARRAARFVTPPCAARWRQSPKVDGLGHVGAGVPAPGDQRQALVTISSPGRCSTSSKSTSQPRSAPGNTHTPGCRINWLHPGGPLLPGSASARAQVARQALLEMLALVQRHNEPGLGAPRCR